MRIRPLGARSSWLGRMCLGLLLLCNIPAILSRAQQPPAEPLSEAIDNLPDFLPIPENGKRNEALDELMEHASAAQKRAAIPLLLRWADDPRANVRAYSLSWVYWSSLSFFAATSPSTPRILKPEEIALTPEEIAHIAPHLLDSSGDVCYMASLALRSVTFTAAGRRELQSLLLPMLDDPKALQPPAAGSMLLYLLLIHNSDQTAIQPALLTFLDRDAQTADSLKECLHNIGLTGAPEPVVNEAITRVFQKGAMSAFLMQFLGRFTLTPEHLAGQRARMSQLADDPSATEEDRHSARALARCWGQESSCRLNH